MIAWEDRGSVLYVQHSAAAAAASWYGLCAAQRSVRNCPNEDGQKDMRPGWVSITTIVSCSSSVATSELCWLLMTIMMRPSFAL
jgi:hypothetical protein